MEIGVQLGARMSAHGLCSKQASKSQKDKWDNLREIVAMLPKYSAVDAQKCVSPWKDLLLGPSPLLRKFWEINPGPSSTNLE